jgi:hypothetical protein
MSSLGPFNQNDISPLIFQIYAHSTLKRPKLIVMSNPNPFNKNYSSPISCPFH